MSREQRPATAETARFGISLQMGEGSVRFMSDMFFLIKKACYTMTSFNNLPRMLVTVRLLVIRAFKKTRGTAMEPICHPFSLAFPQIMYIIRISLLPL